MIVFHKVLVARDMGFYGIPEATTLSTSFKYKRASSDDYRDVLFFTSEEEAEKEMEVKFGEQVDGVMYAVAIERTEVRVDVLNMTIKDLDIKDRLKEHDLDYPITIEDVCNYPLKIYDLLHDRDLISSQDYEHIAFFPLAEWPDFSKQ